MYFKDNFRNTWNKSMNSVDFCETKAMATKLYQEFQIFFPSLNKQR